MKLIRLVLNRLSTRLRYNLVWSKNVILGKNVFLSAPWSSIIGSNTYIGDRTRVNGSIRIAGRGKVSIGKFCAFGADVKIFSANHAMNRPNLQIHLDEMYEFVELPLDSGEVIIGNNVWVGDSAIILNNVNVGDGAVIGSGAIVTRNIPPFSVAVGVPAKVIRKRFSEGVILQLMEIKWWDWPEEKIKRNKRFFSLDLTADPNINLDKYII